MRPRFAVRRAHSDSVESRAFLGLREQDGDGDETDGMGFERGRGVAARGLRL